MGNNGPLKLKKIDLRYVFAILKTHRNYNMSCWGLNNHSSHNASNKFVVCNILS